MAQLQKISKMKVLVLNKLIFPALTCGASLWTTSKKRQRRLSAKENYIGG